MSHYRRCKKKLYLAFIDFQNVFDKVWRTALMYKILNIGIDGRFYDIFKNTYISNISAVKMNREHTEYFGCSLCVHQGDGLSPTLFNIFVNDLQTRFNSEDNNPAIYDNINLGCLIYADDLVILTESESGMQRSLNKLAQYCKKWKIQINVNKCNIMVACKKMSTLPHKFMINGQEFQYVKKYKYLGIVLLYNGSMLCAQEHLVKEQ